MIKNTIKKHNGNKFQVTNRRQEIEEQDPEKKKRQKINVSINTISINCLNTPIKRQAEWVKKR